MKFISNPTKEEIKKAAQALKDGHLVAFPTETVYGLGADATNEKAVSRIYSVKGRPTDHPLIVHISSIVKLTDWAIEIPKYATKLAEEFWPGCMTLILKRSTLAQDFVTGCQDNVGLRVPSHPVALEVLKTFELAGGKGIAAPSANRFGAVSPTTFEAVIEELGGYLHESDIVLDGGQSEVGIESTIIDCTGPRPGILRPGAVTFEMLEEVIGEFIGVDKKVSNIRVSGLLNTHYSPKAQVVLSNTAEVGEGFIAMADINTPKGAIRLASPATIEEYAKIFYNSFRLGDRQKLSKINVVCPTGEGLAMAIRDRLTKAAQGIL